MAAGGDDARAATGPLAGVRVVDLTVNVLGPLATQILGDMGADVIKVETPQGDPMRQVGPRRNPDMATYFLSLNRNKRSIVLDLKRPAGRAALLRLVGTADVFVHNMRLGAAARLGIDYAGIAACNPRIVYAAATGFRKDGRHRDRPAFDDVIQGATGIAALIGRANGEPRYVPMVIADKLVGVILASAIGMALFRRERTGQGQEVHVPMYETMLSFNLVEHLWHGTLAQPEQGLGYPRMLTPHRRPYATKDGHICLLANTDEQWRRLFPAIGCPELVGDARFAELSQRSLNIDALYGILADRMTRRTTVEWQERLDAVDIPNGPMNDLPDLVSDPYLNESGFFQRFDHPSEGPMMTTAVPVAFSEPTDALRRVPPRLGEHTQAVLEELGYSATEIAEIASAA